jgi:hypothetical protein
MLLRKLSLLIIMEHFLVSRMIYQKEVDLEERHKQTPGESFGVVDGDDPFRSPFFW